MKPVVRTLAIGLLAAAAAVACGKRGAPLAPIRIVPGPVREIIARRTGDEIKITFNVPAVNTDSSVPPVVTAVQIYAAAGPPTVAAVAPMSIPVVTLSTPPGAAAAAPGATGRGRSMVAATQAPAAFLVARFPPTPLYDPAPAPRGGRSNRRPAPTTGRGLMVSRYLRDTIDVRPAPPPAPAGQNAAPAEAPPAPAAGTAPPDPRPAPGDTITYTLQVGAERAAAESDREVSVLRVVAVGVTRNRQPGAPSPVLEFPLTVEVAPPLDPTITYTATTATLTWAPGAPAQRFRVYRTDRDGKEDARPLTERPLETMTYTTPTEFGAERCFVVRAVVTRGDASAESAPTPPVCVTAVDTFPPPAPTALSALPTASQVQLLWTAPAATDLAGYLVLRGVNGGAPQPLTTAPIESTVYTDTTVTAGSRYTYVVVAVDRAGNRSQPSNQIEEAR